MDRNKKKLFWLVLAGLFCIVFLTLLTISFYGYVLEFSAYSTPIFSST